MKKIVLEPNNIYRCEHCGGFVFGSDACVAKNHVFCLSCYYDKLKSIYDFKRSSWLKVFFAFFIPSILFIIFLILKNAYKTNSGLEWLKWTYIIEGIITGIWLFVSALSFVINGDLMTAVGDPESLVVSGYVSSSGYVGGYATQTYSAGQGITIIFNILKFLLMMVLIGIGGIVYTIIYWIRLAMAKNAFSRIDQLWNNQILSEGKIGAYCCLNYIPNDSVQNPYQIKEKDTGNIFSIIFNCVFPFENKLIVMGESQDGKEMYVFYALPGYEFIQITDEEYIERIMNIRQRMIENNEFTSRR